MSGYVPNPADDTQPVEGVIAETAAAEFRALKGRVNGINTGSLVTTGIRNIVVNGAFDVNNQFGFTATTPSAIGTPAYVSDEWYHDGTVASLLQYQTVQPPKTPPGYRVCEEITVVIQRANPAVNEAYAFMHPIEGFRMGHLGFGTVGAMGSTLLFYAYSSITGTFAVALRNSLSQSTSVTRSFVGQFTITAPNTWQRFAVTIPGDTLISNTNWPPNAFTQNASIYFDLGTGSTYETTTPNQWIAGNFVRATGNARLIAAAPGAILRIGGVEWKDGSWPVTSTPEIIPVDVTLLQCFRYYYTTTIAVQQTPNLSWVSFPTIMAVSQPIVTGGGAGFTLASLSSTTAAFFQNTAAAQTIVFDARLTQ